MNNGFLLIVALFVLGKVEGVPLDLYVLADDNGAHEVISRAEFERNLIQVNAIFSQVALEFSLRSYNVVSNGMWISFSSKMTFLDVLDTCPSTNGIPLYVVESLPGRDAGIALKDEGCCIAADAGAVALAHELGHMCGLDDIYPVAENLDATGNAVEISVRDDLARESYQPMDWGRYPAGTKQGTLIDRLLMNGYTYTDGSNGVDLTAGDVYGVCIGSSDSDAAGNATHAYVKGMAKVGFLQHGNRHPSRKVVRDLDAGN